MRFDILGGDGDNHRIEAADGLWWGYENLFPGAPRGQRPLEAFFAACGAGVTRFEHYRVVKL
jgi:hypothetical protein